MAYSLRTATARRRGCRSRDTLFPDQTQISTADRTHARTGLDTQRAQAHNHTQNSNPRTHPRQTSRSHAHTHLPIGERCQSTDDTAPHRSHTPSATPTRERTRQGNHRQHVSGGTQQAQDIHAVTPQAHQKAARRTADTHITDHTSQTFTKTKAALISSQKFTETLTKHVHCRSEMLESTSEMQTHADGER